MPRLPRINAVEAERLLYSAGFSLIRSKGSHRVYFKADVRVVVPFHSGKILHPKIVKQVIEAIAITEESSENEE